MRLVVLFDNLGPYHLARMRALADACTLSVVETRPQSAEYSWRPDRASASDSWHVLDRKPNALPASALRAPLERALDAFKPDCVAVSGYSQPVSLLALDWLARHRVPGICMSDSQFIDAPRSRVTEYLKSRIVRQFAAGFVAGTRHLDYLSGLGIPRHRIATGYDVVDNAYFTAMSQHVRENADRHRLQLQLPSRYFLCCSRLQPKKNISTLLRAFAAFTVRRRPNGTAMDLVIAGDGPLLDELRALAASLGIARSVHFAGFVQYGDLPAYYALADALVHVSTVDQWGLVVNEAMACGLPVLVSRACGSAPDLVENQGTGLVVDAQDVDAMTRGLSTLADDSGLRGQMGRVALDVINAWGLPRFVSGMLAAARLSLDAPAHVSKAVDRLITRSALVL